MTLDLDLSTIVQILATAALVGVGRTVWKSSAILTAVATTMDLHVKADADAFSLVRADLAELRREAVAAAKVAAEAAIRAQEALRREER